MKKVLPNPLTIRNFLYKLECRFRIPMGIGKWVTNEKRKEASIVVKNLAGVVGPSTVLCAAVRAL